MMGVCSMSFSWRAISCGQNFGGRNAAATAA